MSTCSDNWGRACYLSLATHASLTGGPYRYLRQEKESAEKIKNQIEIDLHRSKAQVSQQQDVIGQLNSALEEERKFKVVEAETSKQHSEVMRKFEQGRILSESNAMLRQDRERLKGELEEKVTKVRVCVSVEIY